GVFSRLVLAAGLCVHEAHAEQREAAAAGGVAEDKATQAKSVKGSKPAAAPKVVDVKESEQDSGEKSYEFGAVEVEGRLKAPQILYFLRRVRAEFRAGLLGHRSFLPELSDTRRSPALK